MKVLEVGSNSVHFTDFVKDIASQNILSILSEEHIDQNVTDDLHRVSYRNLNPFKILKNMNKLRRALEQVAPDVIHIHQINRLAYFTARAAAKKNIPIITTAWGSDVLLVPKKNKFNRYLVSKTLQRSYCVTADSHEMIEAMKGLYINGNYLWLQYGIEPVASIEKEKVIYSNRLHKTFYRVDRIIDYFAEFSNDHPDWRLIIAGSGEETENLKTLAQQHGVSDKITFVGWLKKEENRLNYAKASIYISIPESDGTAVSLLEAMSAGCVPIVSDLAVSREWINDGENGIIEKNSINPFNEAINMDVERCRVLNQERIHKYATRSQSLGVFNQLYIDAGTK